MSTSMLGGDPQQMQHLAGQFRREAQTVGELQQRVSGALTSTVWTGPAADRFRQDWEGSFRPALARLQESLDQNAHVVEARLRAITEATS
jgi:WXG100 family type VII secretion target